MQNYKEINGNDYVKDSRTTINETMRSIQSMNSGTVFPTTNLFEGMKCYRTDLKKTYTLTDVENNTWVEDAHAALADEATHAASATKLQTPRALNLSGAVTADAASFDGTADATINVKTLDASKLKGTASVSTTGNAATATKLATARTIALSGNATGSTTFDGSGNATINATVSESAHAAKATQDTNGRAFTDTNAYMHISYLANGTDFNDVKTTGIYYCTQDTYTNRPHNSWGILTVYSIGTVKQEYRPDNAAVYYTRECTNQNWTAWSKVAASTADTCTGNSATTTTLNNRGNRNPAANGTKVVSGLNLYQVYDNGYPTTYGNVLSIGGAGGGEILAGWSSADAGMERLYYRNQRDTGTLAWSAWKTVAYTDDISNYAPSKTGSGASGTWGINVSGSATNADKLDGYHENSFLRYRGVAAATGEDTYWNQIGIKEYDNMLPKGVSGTYNFGAVVSLPGGSTRLDIWYNHQCSANGDGLWYRSGWSTDQKAWARLLDSNNFNNWAPTKTGTGASGTWPISISGNAATATTATTAAKANGLTGSLNFPDIGNVATSNKISWSGSTDGADIYYQTTASDQGNLVLNLRDDANCYLRIAYNGAFKSYFTPADGNFHGNVNGKADTAGTADTAKSCSGNAATATKATSANTAATCTGNSATASRLATARSIALTGNATGSAAFDGSGNISISTNVNTATNADKLDGYHASDLLGKITAANTGGIVAASLTANGYVKFANGLILQWGTMTGPKVDDWVWVTTTFPIAFASACFSVTCCDELTSTYDGDVESFVRNIKTNSVDIRYRSDHLGRNLRWLALGV